MGVLVRRPVEGGGNHFAALHVALHVRDFFGTLPHE